MIKNHKDYVITPIGTIYKENGNQLISLESKYRKGLKFISLFSHAIIIINPFIPQPILYLPASLKKQCRFMKQMKIQAYLLLMNSS